jgi:hypothetical protein
LSDSPLYGLLAEFATADALLKAVHCATAAGYRRVDAYSPFHVEGLGEALGMRADAVPFITLLGGSIGGIGGYFMQWYSAVISYPINVGGRPLHSWPSFIPVTFELAVLGAALAAFIGMLALNGLPRLHHPLFGAVEFDLATRNRFFLCIERRDAAFDRHATAEFLRALSPLGVWEIAE